MNIKYYLNIFKALADETRLRIVRVLIKAKTELCVCEIMDSLQESQYNISRHLRELKICGLVQERKAGRWVFYSLVKPKNQIHRRLRQAILSIPEKVLAKDAQRLKKRLALRKDGQVVIGMGGKDLLEKSNRIVTEKEKRAFEAGTGKVAVKVVGIL